MAIPISHGLVLPGTEFELWLRAVIPYMEAFERVAAIRSPAGNDLNRFRNVTAIQAPGVWFNDDALVHIRRAYPMVVRVDVISAINPTDLQNQLQARITNDDRFGSSINGGAHIHDRFVLSWPTDARPARITRAFKAEGDGKYDGIDILTYDGVPVRSGAAGQVGNIVQTGQGVWVAVASQLHGQLYITWYGALRDVAVTNQQQVKDGDKLGLATGNVVKIVVQKPGDGIDGFSTPDLIDPTLLIYWQGMRLRPTTASLRVRDKAGTFGEIIGTLKPEDAVETEEVHGRALAKLGVEDQWLRIRRAGVREAYAAAWFLEAYGVNDPVEGVNGVAIPGMNLDIDHPLGLPDPNVIKKLGWVRIKFNVSFDPRKSGGDRYGNTDVDYTYSRYVPQLKRYTDAGLKVVLILNHQTYGEGAGYVWPEMNADKWRELTGRFAEIARRTAQKFAGTGMIYAYQIWNEQDTDPVNARAAVPIPAQDYGNLFAQAMQAIRSADTRVRIITGGHIGGSVNGPAYARQAINAMGGLKPDGVAFHPYGRGPSDNIFSVYGSIAESVQNYSRILPNLPVWITEWGVLDKQNQPELTPQVNDYALGFLRILQAQFPGQVAAAIWYAWADSMDNGFGLVDRNGQPKSPLYEKFLSY